MFVRLNKKYSFLKAFSLKNFQIYNSPLPNALFVENALICKTERQNFDNICKFKFGRSSEAASFIKAEI
jgi:hypothetical protein